MEINNLILNYWPPAPSNKIVDNIKRKTLVEVNKFLKGAKNQLIGLGKSVITGLIKRVYLGNLFTVSPSKVKDDFKSFASGNILNSVRNVTNTVRKFNDNASRTGSPGNLFDT